jgi:3-methyladenine DNA glycosylase AlkD
MTVADIIDQLKQKATPAYHAGMLRFGVDNSKALGVPIPELRKLARYIKRNHQLALELWDTGIHEARVLASMIDDPAMVTPVQMDAWVKEFYSWDLCDQVCGNLFDRTPFAVEKALVYTTSKEEYIKRAGFVLMAEYAVHNKTAGNEVFIALLPIIEREAWDDRNFVKKAANWALRQIGKRNPTLRIAAIESASRIAQQDSKAAKWVATNALKELLARVD